MVRSQIKCFLFGLRAKTRALWRYAIWYLSEKAHLVISQKIPSFIR